MRKTHFLFCFAACLLTSFSALAQTPSQDSLYKKALADTLVKYQPVMKTPDANGGELRIFEKVDVEASIDLLKWRRQLERHLQAPIKKAAKKGMKAGHYTVLVRFIVEKDGSITDVRALNDPGYGLAEASVNVVRTGPQWTPGEQNGRKVRSYHTQPITFVISDK